jgi:hypothetical protein
MFLVRNYYRLKPFMPRSLRMAFRRWRAGKRQQCFAHEWPIKPSAAATPENWPGWPDGKKFAFVLTHDVEGGAGLARCRAVADTEVRLGFRSAFNFIPEGDYRVPSELRSHLAAQGFEIGVHDLRHDGKLYWSRENFRRDARAINRYLREWNAVGFRSGFMHHNLEWLHDLEVLYDSSTFDTDPFEPQPDGVDTIFPFWVSAPRSSLLAPGSELSAPRPDAGYIELPYTLAQDVTLFLMLQETSIDIWKRKLDWVVEHGGMAMVDVHPDYLDVLGVGRPGISYSIHRYIELLEYVRDNYAGLYWQPLPREVAAFAKSHLVPATANT